MRGGASCHDRKHFPFCNSASKDWNKKVCDWIKVQWCGTWATWGRSRKRLLSLGVHRSTRLWAQEVKQERCHRGGEREWQNTHPPWKPSMMLKSCESSDALWLSLSHTHSLSVNERFGEKICSRVLFSLRCSFPPGQHELVCVFCTSSWPHG